MQHTEEPARAGSATHDRTQDFLHHDGDCAGLLLFQVSRRELPQGIRDRSHRASLALLRHDAGRFGVVVAIVVSWQLAEDAVDDFSRVGFSGLG